MQKKGWSVKKALAVLLFVGMALNLCACSGAGIEETEPTISLVERVIARVEEELRVYIYLKYSALKQPEVTTYVEKLGDGKYHVTGKASYRDEYGVTYAGTYEAEVTYLSDMDRFSVAYELEPLQSGKLHE